MKKQVMNYVASKKWSLIGVVGLVTLFLGLIIYSFLLGNRGNEYQLTGSYDQKTNRYYIEILVEHPKEEIIRVNATNEMTLSPESLENVQDELFDVLPVEENETGVNIRVKASQQNIQIKLPIIFTNENQQTFQVHRKGKLLQEFETNILETIQNEKTSLAQPKKVKEQTQFLNVSTQKPKFLALAEETQGTTVQVKNYTELMTAVGNPAVGKIELTANITASSQQLKEITRDLEIDGQGHQLDTRLTSVFRLGNTNSTARTFRLKNLKVNYAATSNAFIIASNTRYSTFWTVNVAKVTHVNNAQGKAGAYFAEVRCGKVEIEGDLEWNCLKNSTASNNKGIITAANVKISNQATVSLSSVYTVLRIYPMDNAIDTSIIINSGAQVTLTSERRQAIWANSEGATNLLMFVVSDPGTTFQATSEGTFYGSEGGVVTLQGSSKNGQISKTEVSNGAVVTIHAKASASEASKAVPVTTAGFVNQVRAGKFIVDGEGSQLTIEADGEAHNFNAALRFRLVGEQEFLISNQAEMKVIKHAGAAAAIRLYGRENSFRARSGGKVTIRKEGKQRAQDGGDTGGQQAIQFTIDGGGTSTFEVEGTDSMIYAKSTDGPAIEALSGNFQFIIGQEATFRMEGVTYSANRGIVHAGSWQINIKVNQPKFYDFCNQRVNGGQVFSTGSNNTTSQTFTSSQTTFSVWNKKAGVDVTANPDFFWGKIDYQLSGQDFRMIAYSEYPKLLNSNNYRGANNYTRMTGNNYQAVVDELRIPTNADKTIYGHVSVPYSIDGQESRDAWEEEVWVKLQLVDEQGNEIAVKTVPTKGKNDYWPGVEIYGEAARGGIFYWEMDDFLKAGTQVKVLGAYRGGSDSEADSGSWIYSEEDKLLTKQVEVLDVTPPTSLTVDTNIDEDNRKILGNTMKQITGTIDLWDERDQRIVNEVYVFAKDEQGFLKDVNNNPLFFKVTMEDEAVSEAEPTRKKWMFDLPAYLTLGKKIEFFAKDSVNLEPTIKIALPDTLTIEPNQVMGNVNPSQANYAAYKGYHDAVDADRFIPSLLLDVVDTAPSAPTASIKVASYESNSATEALLTVDNQLIYTITVRNRDVVGKDPLKAIAFEVDLAPQLDYEFDLLRQTLDERLTFEVVGNKLIVRFAEEQDFPPGASLDVTLVARVKNAEQAITTNVVAKGKSTVEVPFVPGAPIPENRLSLSAEASVTVHPGTLNEPGEQITLTVVNNKLKIFYTNVEQFTVYLDGEEYKSYTVKKQKTTDSMVLDIPINDIRNKVAVKYLDAENQKKWAYWNNKWDFVTEPDE